MISIELSTSNKETATEVPTKRELLESIVRKKISAMNAMGDHSEDILASYFTIALEDSDMHRYVSEMFPFNRVVVDVYKHAAHYMSCKVKVEYYSCEENYIRYNSSHHISFRVMELGMNCSSCTISDLWMENVYDRSDRRLDSYTEEGYPKLLKVAEDFAKLCGYTTVMYTTSSGNLDSLCALIESTYTKIHEFTNARTGRLIKYYVKQIR